MTFLTKLIVFTASYIAFFSFSSFGVVLSEVPKIFEQIEQAKNPVWQIGNSFGEGVGFFPKPDRLVTSFDTAALLLKDNNINSIVLSQNGDSTVKVRQLLSVDAYGLALFETEPIGASLNITEDLPDSEENLTIPTYADGKFINVQKRGNIFFSKSGFYFFPVDGVDVDIEGIDYKHLPLLTEIKGSPVLNEQGDIVGVILNGKPKEMLTLKSGYLKEFTEGNRGLDCSGAGSPKDCIRKAMDSLKKQAYEEGHAVSQFLLALMYFQKAVYRFLIHSQEERHWWIDLSRNFEYDQSGTFSFLEDRRFGYNVRESLMKREGMRIGRTLSDIEEEAFQLMSLAAEQGLPEALFDLSMKHYLQKDPNQSLRGIFKLLSEAAAEEFYMAQIQRASMYLHGEGTDKDIIKAFEELNKVADKNFIPALLKLADLYSGEGGIIMNSEKAEEYIKRAVDLGSPQAEYKLADLKLTGRKGVKKDIREALELFTRSADKNNAAAQYQLGIMYDQGIGVEKNPLKAYGLMNRSAKNGYPPAKKFLNKQCVSSWGAQQTGG